MKYFIYLMQCCRNEKNKKQTKKINTEVREEWSTCRSLSHGCILECFTTIWPSPALILKTELNVVLSLSMHDQMAGSSPAPTKLTGAFAPLGAWWGALQDGSNLHTARAPWWLALAALRSSLKLNTLAYFIYFMHRKPIYVSEDWCFKWVQKS